VSGSGLQSGLVDPALPLRELGETRLIAIPRAEPGETGGANAGDVAGAVAHGRGREDDLGAEVAMGQALEEVRRAALGDARLAIDDEVFDQAEGGFSLTEEREDDARVA